MTNGGMFDVFKNRVTLQGTLTAETALRIGAGRAIDVAGTDLPIVRDALGKPYIPGSSFKGALRAQAESLVRAFVPAGQEDRRWACNPISRDSKKDWCVPSAVDKSDKDVNKATCLVCHVFGSHWFAARARFQDLPVDASRWFGQFEVRNGVAIDRDTETASEGKLYNFEVVPAGTRFLCQIVVENAEDWELGLLMASLRPFECGTGALGGARSRGLGVVRLTWEQRTRLSQDRLLDYLDNRENAEEQLKDADVAPWLVAFRTEIEKRLKEGTDAPQTDQ